MTLETRNFISFALMLLFSVASYAFGSFKEIPDGKPYALAAGAVMILLTMLIFSTCIKPFRWPQVRRKEMQKVNS